MPRHSTWPWPDRVRPGQTPQILAARPPGAQPWDLGMEARASQTGAFRAGFTLSGHWSHCPWCARPDRACEP